MPRKSWNWFKTFKTRVLRTAEFAFIKPYTNSEVNQEYHKNTIFNNFNRFINITNKTGFITPKLDLYKTRIYANFTIKPDLQI